MRRIIEALTVVLTFCEGTIFLLWSVLALSAPYSPDAHPSLPMPAGVAAIVATLAFLGSVCVACLGIGMGYIFQFLLRLADRIYKQV